jgi:hypothetical protein
MRIETLLFAATLAVAPAAHAFNPASSAAEYSADWTMETEMGAMKAKVNHAANKERREMNQGGDPMIMITRQDKKLAWNLMPSQRMYMEMNLAAGADSGKKGADVGDYDFEQTVVGEETVNGMRTTKSKIVMKPRKPDGKKMGGFMWATKDGIMVKLDAIGVDGDKKMRMKMELTNIKVGKQDPALFEVPAGYTKLDMGNMGAMMGNRGSAKSGGDGEKKGGMSLKDAWKMMR